MTQKIPAGLSVRAFPRRHWQKKPLLADRRRLAAALALAAEAAHRLYQWDRAGYIELDTRERVSE